MFDFHQILIAYMNDMVRTEKLICSEIMFDLALLLAFVKLDGAGKEPLPELNNPKSLLFCQPFFMDDRASFSRPSQRYRRAVRIQQLRHPRFDHSCLNSVISLRFRAFCSAAGL